MPKRRLRVGHTPLPHRGHRDHEVRKVDELSDVAAAAAADLGPTPLPPGLDDPDTPLAEKLAASISIPTRDVTAGPVPNDWVGFMDRYADRPVLFVKEILGATPLAWQEIFLGEIATGRRRISVRAGHGVGKSTACSWAILWHALTKFPQKTVVTAPTAGQLFDALFAELKHWINRLPEWIRVSLDVKSDRVELVGARESSFISARTSSSDKPEALAGVHSENVLLVCDEASAIPEPVFESAAGSMSGEKATTVLIGNPTRNTGLFFKTHHALKEEWFTMHVSSLDNPLVSRDFIKQIEDTYGPDSNAYRVRVLGEFSLAEDDVLIPAELVDAAMVRDIQEDPFAQVTFGLDVARFGDDRSVLCIRKGNVVLEFVRWSGIDLMTLVGAVVNLARQHKPAEIMVDSIGLGAGVADRLRELGYNVRDVNVAEAAAMNPGAARLRDDLWMQLRDWLRARACKLPQLDELRADLVGPTYKFMSNGKLQVEAKADMKKRGLRSPDYADALALTFASAHAGIGGRAFKWTPGQPLRRKIGGLV